MAAYSTYTDQELVVLLKQGDEMAFTVVYERHWRVIYGHIYKMLKDEEQAKDLVQDLFSGIWTDSHKLPAEGTLIAFLYTVARNKVLNHLRHNRYKDDYLSSLATFEHEMTNVTIEQLEEKDLLEAVEREIEKLPPRMREVFELSRKHNMSNKEIAARLGTSDETVKKQVHNSLKAIRAGLNESAGAGLVALMFLR